MTYIVLLNLEVYSYPLASYHILMIISDVTTVRWSAG